MESRLSEIRLLKEPVKGLGIRISDRPGPEGSSVIAISDITKEGPAHVDGRLKKGSLRAATVNSSHHCVPLTMAHLAV